MNVYHMKMMEKVDLIYYQGSVEKNFKKFYICKIYKYKNKKKNMKKE